MFTHRHGTHTMWNEHYTCAHTRTYSDGGEGDDDGMHTIKSHTVESLKCFRILITLHTL